jgi:hypothetical protein
MGVLSGANSFTGTTSSDGVSLSSIGPVVGTDEILMKVPNATNLGLSQAGRLFVYYLNGAPTPGKVPALSFSSNPSGDVTLLAGDIAYTLGLGSVLSLQANNDIIVNPGAGIFAPSGSLELRAGRNVILNDSIKIGDSSITVVANDPAANPAYRGSGSGDLVIQASTTPVVMQADDISVSAQNILIQGGDAVGAYAAIIGNSTVNLTADQITLTAGAGNGADAVIAAYSGDLKYTGACNACDRIFFDPFLDPGTQVGLYLGPPDFTIGVDAILSLGDPADVLKKKEDEEKKKKKGGQCAVSSNS